MFKIGDKVKVIGIAKGHESNKDFQSYIGREGVITELIDRSGYWPIRVKFGTGPIDYQGFYDYCLELIQEKKEMPAKFKIGDTVKVTATQEELQAINATHCFEKEGIVVKLGPITFFFEYKIPNAGVGVANLNYAHAELVKEKTEPKFKVGDLVRGIDSGELYVVSCYNQDGNLVVSTQQSQYDKNPKIRVFPDNQFKLVTELKVGDRVALPPSIIEIVSVEEYKKKDYLYRVKTSSGVQQNLANELMPKGTCTVPEKFSENEIVLYKDKSYEGVGVVISDDESVNNRYSIRISKDHSRAFSGNELTKIPQDMFPELRNILKEK